MRKLFTLAALAALVAFAGPAQAQVQQFPLSGLFYSDGPGAGIDVEGAVLGTPGLVGVVPPAKPRQRHSG